MGKLQSKHASKRRESPEGGSFVANMLTRQKDVERVDIQRYPSRYKQKLCGGEPVEHAQLHHHNCLLEVALPPERARPDRGHGCHLLAGRPSRTRGGRAVGDTECGTAVEGEAGQEWVFTVYD
ncbi:hypothetical protein CRUP_037012, partial [Coryphaenoides rupestris]